MSFKEFLLVLLDGSSSAMYLRNLSQLTIIKMNMSSVAWCRVIVTRVLKMKSRRCGVDSLSQDLAS